jgi:hypothetical protein
MEVRKKAEPARSTESCLRERGEKGSARDVGAVELVLGFSEDIVARGLRRRGLGFRRVLLSD